MKEIDDGKSDCFITYKDKTVMSMTEEGYKSVGLNYEQAKKVTVLMSVVLAEIVKGLTSPAKESPRG